MYLEIPAVEGTPASRIEALRESRDLLKEEPATSKASMFGGESHNPGSVAGPTALIRLATYIETGHDYKDTHPEGKRRPIIRNTTNVTVMAPSGADAEDIEHFLHHVEKGDFAEFIKDMVAQQDSDQETEGDGDTEDQRPKFEL